MDTPLPPPHPLCGRPRWEWEAHAENEIRRRRPGAEVCDEMVAAGLPRGEAEATVRRVLGRERAHAGLLIGGAVVGGLVYLLAWHVARARGLQLYWAVPVAIVMPVVALIDGLRRMARAR